MFQAIKLKVKPEQNNRDATYYFFTMSHDSIRKMVTVPLDRSKNTLGNQK